MNVAGLLRRLDRVFAHYGAAPRRVACSATVGTPAELGRRLTWSDLALVDEDGSDLPRFGIRATRRASL